MSRKIDDGLRPLLHQNIRKGFHWQAIESGLTGGGIPDSNFCSQGVEGWVECKWTAGYQVTLDVDQVGWHMTRARRGGRTFIAVRRHCAAGPRRVAADELYLIPGIYAASAVELGLRGLPPDAILGCWAGGPTQWNWDQVADLLVNYNPVMTQPSGSNPPPVSSAAGEGGTPF